MNVSEIIDVIADFSIGSENALDSQRAIFLRYLNLYKDFLYRKTALLNADIQKSHIFNGLYYPISDWLIPASSAVMTVTGVVSLLQRKDLLHKAEAELVKTYYDKDSATLIKKGAPSYYSLKKTDSALEYGVVETRVKLYPEPEQECPLLVSWVQNCPEFTLKTEGQDIPFPHHFHSLLADGALWYVFQEEGGFRDNRKSAEAKLRCERGEQELIAFLVNSFDDQSEAAYGI